MKKDARKEMHQVKRQDDVSFSCVTIDLLWDPESTPPRLHFTIFSCVSKTQFNSTALRGYIFESSLTFQASEVASRFQYCCTDSLRVASVALHSISALSASRLSKGVIRQFHFE